MKSYKELALRQIRDSRINEKDLKEIEKRSLEIGKWISHPLLDQVKIYGKDYKCTEHPKIGPLHRGTMRQHMEGKEHQLDFYTGQPIKFVKDLPPLPTMVIKKSDPATKRKIPYFEEDKPEKKKIISYERRLSHFSGPEIFSRSLRSSNIDYSVSTSPKPSPQPTSWEPKDEWDEKIEMWQKIRQLEAMGVPKNEVDKLKKKYGFIKEEKEREYTPAEIELACELLKKTDDEFVKIGCTFILIQSLPQQIKKLGRR